MNTKFVAATAALLLAGVAAGCSTTESRVASHRAEFESWPADVQQKVRASTVDIGFTQEMVRVAFGEPDRVAMRTTERGVEDVWVYFDRGPQFSFGFGMGTVRGHSAYGGGVAVGSEGFYAEEVLRVVFEGGRVSAIESKK